MSREPTFSKAETHFSLLISHFSFPVCLAIREEGVGNYLGGLAASGVVVGQEVGEVIRWHTLPRRGRAAWVPTHHLVPYQPVDVCVKCTVRGYILELLSRRCLVEASSVGD